MTQIVEVPGYGKVEFPDGMSDEQIAAAIKRNILVGKPSTAKDIAKSAASAPFKAAANLVGLPSTILDLAALGIGKLVPSIREIKPELPNVGALARRGFEQLGLMHEPQTTAGKFTGAAVEGALSAPSNLPMMLTGLGAGVGSEAGGALGAKYGETGETVGRFGGALAGGLTAGRLIRPLQNTLTAEQSAINERAKEMGMRLTPGQQTGSRRMLAFENTSEALPGGGFLARIRAENARRANEVALRSIGETGAELSPTVLSRAADRIGSEFNRLTQGRTITLDNTFYDKVRVAIRDQMKLAEPDQAVLATLQKWLPPRGAGNARIPSDVYQANRSAYATDMRQAFRQEGWASAALAKKALVKALDDAAERSLPAADLAAFKTARQQWANLEAVEAADLARTGYNISPHPLAGALRRQNQKVGRIPLGDRELVDVSRMGSILRDATPNSGSPERLYWMGLLSGGGAGTGAVLGGVPGAVGGAIAGTALPAIAQRTIMAPGINPYLARGLMPGFRHPGLLAETVRGGVLSQ